MPTLREALDAGVSSRIEGLDPEAAWPLYTTQDHGTATYARNPGCWLADVDLTGISPWNSTGGPQRAGTAITPLHVVYANHFPLGVGATIRFVTADNAVVTRTIAAETTVTGTDIIVARLDSPLPASIRPLKVFPAEFEDHYRRPPESLARIAGTDQSENANVWSITATTPNGSAEVTYAADPTWGHEAVGGDSGNPLFAVLDGEAVLWSHLHFPQSGPAYFALAGAIEAIVAADGESLSYAGGGSHMAMEAIFAGEAGESYYAYVARHDGLFWNPAASQFADLTAGSAEDFQVDAVEVVDGSLAPTGLFQVPIPTHPISGLPFTGLNYRIIVYRVGTPDVLLTGPVPYVVGVLPDEQGGGGFMPVVALSDAALHGGRLLLNAGPGGVHTPVQIGANSGGASVTLAGRTVLNGPIVSNNPDHANAIQKVIADALLGRSIAGGSDGGRTVSQALRASRNRVAFDVPSVGQFTVFREDDTTPDWVGTYSRPGGILTEIDPTG